MSNNLVPSKDKYFSIKNMIYIGILLRNVNKGY